MEPTVFDLLNLTLTTILGLLVYRFQQRQHDDSWRRTLGEFHHVFWNDEEIREIRCAVAYPVAYGPLEVALKRRMDLYRKDSKAEQLTKDEYILIDKLDKFLTLLLRILKIAPESKSKYYHKLWQSLLVDFWVKNSLSQSKPELYWYVTTFYPDLYSAARSEKWLDLAAFEKKKQRDIGTELQARSKTS